MQEVPSRGGGLVGAAECCLTARRGLELKRLCALQLRHPALVSASLGVFPLWSGRNLTAWKHGQLSLVIA